MLSILAILNAGLPLPLPCPTCPYSSFLSFSPFCRSHCFSYPFGHSTFPPVSNSRPIASSLTEQDAIQMTDVLVEQQVKKKMTKKLGAAATQTESDLRLWFCICDENENLLHIYV
jgi:hypothetical protein